MASTQGYPVSYRVELLSGVHDFTTDTFKLALYTGSAELTPATTTVYTTDGEVDDDGTGYTAGGEELTVATPVAAEGGDDLTVIVDFDDVVWDPSTITAAAALVYNSSKSNKAVFIIVFDAERTSDNGPLRVQVPLPAYNTAAMRLESAA